MNTFAMEIHFDDGPYIVVAEETSLSRDELLKELASCLERGKSFFCSHTIVSASRVRYIRLLNFTVGE